MYTIVYINISALVFTSRKFYSLLKHRCHSLLRSFIALKNRRLHRVLRAFVYRFRLRINHAIWQNRLFIKHYCGMAYERR